jgi:hypothetical protein
VQEVTICVGGLEVTLEPPQPGQAMADGKQLTPAQWLQLVAVILQAVLTFLGGGGTGPTPAPPPAK